MLRSVLRSPAAAATALASATIATASNELSTAKVAGSSMSPTFQTATTILVKQLNAVERGDVVVLRSPEPGCEAQLLTKRVVAVGGDWLYSRNGRLVRVPTRHVWVEGDNAANSNDSTHYGAVPHSNLAGTVVAKIWPPAQAGAVADRKGECNSRVIPSHAASRLRSRPTETGETLRSALLQARDAMKAYTHVPAMVAAAAQPGSA